jgi:hypothetical protein
MTSARKALTRSQVIALCARQTDTPILCGCGCGVPLDPAGEGIVDEHVLPRLLGALGSERERDALSNRALYRRPCAQRKTTADVKQIAKAKRQAGEKGQQARRASGKTKSIPSRKLEGGGSIPKRNDPWGVEYKARKEREADGR